MSKSIWIRWKDYTGVELFDTVDELTVEAQVKDLRKAFVEQSGDSVKGIHPASIQVRETENAEMLRASKKLKKYFVAPCGVAPASGPGRSEDTALFLTVPPKHQQQPIADDVGYQHSTLQEEFRALKKLVIEQQVIESRAVSYAEYYDEKLQEGRIEAWHPTERPGDSVQLPEYLRDATNKVGSEKDVVKPFWKDVLSRHKLLPAWHNGYEIAHLGTKIPDITIYPPDIEKPCAGDFVAAGDCKGDRWSGTSHAELGQIMSYVHRMLDAQPMRQLSYGFVTNNRIVVLIKGYRCSESPYVVRWCVSSVLTFDAGMKLWLRLMREDSGYHRPPVLQGFPLSFSRTLRPGGTCRAFEATYRGAVVVAKLYEDDASATDNATRTMNAFSTVIRLARDSSRIGTLAQVPKVVITEGRWSLITPKGTPLTQQSITKTHVEQLVNVLKLVHDEGIIHRDVRVSNIFYLSDEQVLLNDWGASVSKNVTTLYAGAPSPHIHPEIPPSDMYYPSAQHDLYSLVSSLAQLLMPGVNDKSRARLLDGAYQAANDCNYELLKEKINEHMR